MPGPRSLFLLLALGLGWGGTGQLRAETQAEPPIRGIVISCQTWGREWGSDEMVEALREIKALGATWVSDLILKQLGARCFKGRHCIYKPPFRSYGQAEFIQIALAETRQQFKIDVVLGKQFRVFAKSVCFKPIL